MDDVQVQQMVEAWRKQLNQQMADMKLRQWCVEKAIEVAPRVPRVTSEVNFGDLCEAILSSARRSPTCSRG
jgi:hypothetical protein